jgi:tRNA threonylcarbamoyladenosine biosynthesis protein TsaB
MSVAGASQPRMLLLETSHQVGQVALSLGDAVVGRRSLDEARRHARDLAPAIDALLKEQGWRAKELDAVAVSVGPGSYTGLRVGVMSAKTLAYALDCKLIALETFAVIFAQLPDAIRSADVISDGQQGKIYVQRFSRDGESEPLAIRSFVDWRAELPANQPVTGPGLETFAGQMTDHAATLPSEHWLARPEGLLQIALPRYKRGEHDDPFAVEPLYLRPSSAEENWRNRKTQV